MVLRERLAFFTYASSDVTAPVKHKTIIISVLELEMFLITYSEQMPIGCNETRSMCVARNVTNYTKKCIF